MFQSIDELPALIRTALPEKAQELYRAAFNRTWEKLSAGEDKNPSEITAKAHKAARLAVGYEFRRDAEGAWHHDPVGEEMKRNGRGGSPPDTG
jgi:cation transport regulator ChaB